MELCLVDKVDAFHLPGSYSCCRSSWERRFPYISTYIQRSRTILIGLGGEDPDFCTQGFRILKNMGEIEKQLSISLNGVDGTP